MTCQFDDFDTRALMAASLEEDACCLQCGDFWERWRMPNGICPACSELNESEEQGQ